MSECVCLCVCVWWVCVCVCVGVWACGRVGVWVRGVGLSVHAQAGGCVGGLGSPDDTGLTI